MLAASLFPVMAGWSASRTLVLIDVARSEKNNTKQHGCRVSVTLAVGMFSHTLPNFSGMMVDGNWYGETGEATGGCIMPMVVGAVRGKVKGIRVFRVQAVLPLQDSA